MPASLLDPNSQAKFTYALPSPPVIDATGGGNYTIQANQVDNFFMGLVDPLTNLPLYTTVYSYQWLQPNGTVRYRQPVWADDHCGLWRTDPCHLD